MKPEKNKGGRPPKCSEDDKKAFVWKYFYSELDGNKQAFQSKNIYSQLSQYAQQKGIDLAPYDFSRSQTVKDLIRSLSEPTEESPSTSTFRTLDIDYFFNAKLSLDECKKRLVEINAYYFQSHQRASKILEQFDFQKDTIAALKEECKRLNVEMHNLEEMLFPLKQKRQDNIRLKAENAHLKKMIKTHITDPIVLSMIEGTKPPISEATALIAPEGKEPAMLNISKFEKESENLPPSIADIKNFINKRK